MSAPTLKPCPFCGDIPHAVMELSCSVPSFAVICEQCMGAGPVAYLHGRDPESGIDLEAEAAELWNNRA